MAAVPRKRKVARRTFDQIRAEQRAEEAAFIQAHAGKLVDSGQRDEAIHLTAVAGMITAGFAEKEGKGR